MGRATGIMLICVKTKMKLLILVLHGLFASGAIRDSAIINKLIKPVGGSVSRTFVPLTEIPPPDKVHQHVDGRRHLPEDCTTRPDKHDVFEGAKVDVFGEYYDERVGKTMATVVIPDHIDHKHFEVTTQVPYLTLGPIEAIGYHPSTIKSEHPAECEKIYQDHIADQYSDEMTDYSEESLEMARIPLAPDTESKQAELDDKLGKMYDEVVER